MRDWIRITVWGLLSGLRSRRDLALENVALRQQLMVLRRQPGTVSLKNRDRLFWMGLQRVWRRWFRALILGQPATVVGWQRMGCRSYWRWKSRAKGGRPRVDPSVRGLIRHMWSANPTWGTPRIQAELHKLGIEVSDSTQPFGDIGPRGPGRHPSTGARFWRTTWATSWRWTSSLSRFNVTTSPSAAWTARQLIEAFPYDTRPRFLLHDRDKIFTGDVVVLNWIHHRYARHAA